MELYANMSWVYNIYYMYLLQAITRPLLLISQLSSSTTCVLEFCVAMVGKMNQTQTLIPMAIPLLGVCATNALRWTQLKRMFAVGTPVA